jgi:hypothetical protein
MSSTEIGSALPVRVKALGRLALALDLDFDIDFDVGLDIDFDIDFERVLSLLFMDL